MEPEKIIQFTFADTGFLGKAGFFALTNYGRIFSKTSDKPFWSEEELPKFD